MANGLSLAQLVTAVYTETNRPDYVDETLQAIFASTIKMHGLEFFYKDIVPAQIIFDNPGYIQTLDTTVLPFYRAMAYLRKDAPAIYANYELNPTPMPPLFQDPTGMLISSGVARKIIRPIAPDDILDEFDVEKTDVMYQAGRVVMIRSSTSLQYCLGAWYAWPNCDVANKGAAYSSWIAEENPYAIVFDAASAILQKTGMTDAARKYDNVNPDNPGLVQSQMLALRTSNIVMEGR